MAEVWPLTGRAERWTLGPGTEGDIVWWIARLSLVEIHRINAVE